MTIGSSLCIHTEIKMVWENHRISPFKCLKSRGLFVCMQDGRLPHGEVPGDPQEAAHQRRTSMCRDTLLRVIDRCGHGRSNSGGRPSSSEARLKPVRHIGRPMILQNAEWWF